MHYKQTAKRTYIFSEYIRYTDSNSIENSMVALINYN